MQVGGSYAAADTLAAHHALASRLEAELTQWASREGAKAPAAARSLARLAVAIAKKMREDLERIDQDVRSGKGTLAPDRLVGVTGRTGAIERIRDLGARTTAR